MRNDHPNYLERFSEICAQVKSHQLNTDKRESLSKATWELALFTYKVTNKHFQSAASHLAKVEHFLKEIPQESKTEVETASNLALNKLKRFVKNLQQQYGKLLEKKGIADKRTIIRSDFLN